MSGAEHSVPIGGGSGADDNGSSSGSVFEASPSALALDHLRLRIAPIHRALTHAVEAQKRRNAELGLAQQRTLAVSDIQVDQLLLEASTSITHDYCCFSSHSNDGNGHPAELTLAELSEQTSLRHSALQLGFRLPIDAAMDALGIVPAEVDALVLCAAVELNRAYGRIYAFVQDSIGAQLP
ncbi:MAG: hypothetical protein ACR2RL_25235, partial [Gammaproteobacteria bacterium]